jgi:uncharacterized protein (TIGR02996 family)
MSTPRQGPEYEALYAAVCSAPDDDAARLVFADWLEEHGEPHRAAYVRAGTQLHRLQADDPDAAAAFAATRVSYADWGRYHDPADVSPAVARMAELVKQRADNAGKAEARWKAALGKRKSGSIFSFARGFPHGVFVSNAKQYAQKQPPEEMPGYVLAVKAADAGFDALLACRNFATAGGVLVRGVSSAEQVRKLGAAAGPSFRSLSIDFTGSDPGILTAVATQPNWSGLTYLGLDAALDGSRAELDLPAEFAAAAQLRGLTELSLGLRGLTGAGLGHLVRLGLPRLRWLDVHFNDVDDEGARTLAQAEGLSELRSLNLGTNRIGDAGAEALAGCRSQLAVLAALDLGGNDITDPAAAAALLAGPCFPRLVGLSLRDNRFGDLDAKMLAASGRGPTLRFLSLRHCSLTAAAARSVATAPALAHLCCVDLAGGALGDDGAAAIAEAAWDRLSYLHLAQNGIGPDGVKALAAWPGMARLEYLNLNDNPIGLAGAEALAACRALKKRCRKLVVPYDKERLPEGGRELLVRAFGRRIDYR